MKVHCGCNGWILYVSLMPRRMAYEGPLWILYVSLMPFTVAMFEPIASLCNAPFDAEHVSCYYLDATNCIYCLPVSI